MSSLYVGYPLPSTITLIDCQKCNTSHPASRQHCRDCGRPSLFIDPTGACRRCVDLKGAKR